MSSRTQQTTLSLLWLVVSLNILIADILTLYIPESRDILAEVAGDTAIPLVMLFGAVFIQIPVLMIPACMLVGCTARKWLNIIAGVITILFVVGGGSLFPHYILLAAVEVVCLIAIIAIAWRSVDTGQPARDAG